MSEGSAAGTGFTGAVDETGVSSGDGRAAGPVSERGASSRSREGRVVGGEAWDEVQPAASEGRPVGSGSAEGRAGALWREVRGAGLFGRRAGRPSDDTNTQDAFPPPVASARFPDTPPTTPRPGAPLVDGPGSRDGARAAGLGRGEAFGRDTDGATASRYAGDSAASGDEVFGDEVSRGDAFGDEISGGDTFGDDAFQGDAFRGEASGDAAFQGDADDDAAYVDGIGGAAVSDFEVSVVRPYMSRTTVSAPAADTPR
ncbi:MAG TPA: hypothetical protein VIU15_46295, partial [Streptomyces sp.]